MLSVRADYVLSSPQVDTAGSMIDEAINGGFRGTFIIKGARRGAVISSMSRMICIYIALSQLGAWFGLGLQVRQRMLAGWGATHFFEIAATVGWSSKNFSRMAAVCEFGERRPSSQLRSEAKVA
jgi:hypothetical protein